MAPPSGFLQQPALFGESRSLTSHVDVSLRDVNAARQQLVQRVNVTDERQWNAIGGNDQYIVQIEYGDSTRRQLRSEGWNERAARRQRNNQVQDTQKVP